MNLEQRLTTAQLERQLKILEQRLEDGETRIAEAEAQGVDTTDWRAFWAALFERYNAIYRRLDEVPA